MIKRFKRESMYYDNEKLYNPPAVAEVGGWDLGRGDDNTHAIPVQLFPKHVLDLHLNQVSLSITLDWLIFDTVVIVHVYSIKIST